VPTTQKIERFTQVKANQILAIREGGGIIEPAFRPRNHTNKPAARSV
jgi:hypothetical protein